MVGKSLDDAAMDLDSSSLQIPNVIFSPEICYSYMLRMLIYRELIDIQFSGAKVDDMIDRSQREFSLWKRQLPVKQEVIIFFTRIVFYFMLYLVRSVHSIDAFRGSYGITETVRYSYPSLRKREFRVKPKHVSQLFKALF